MKILSAIGLIFSFFFASMQYGFQPTVIFDAAAPGAEVSSRASGYLYGLAEENVPDALMAQSLDIASVSQKVIGGLQHPIGDVDHVAGNLDACDYIVVYLQDAYSTWYYDNDAIFEARRAGTYDWQRYLTEDFFPKVREKVTALQQTAYADRLVYCLFNECDNGVWFGTWMEEGQWAAFDDAGRANFFSAWEQTYALVRELAPDALIGGPGYCDYSPEKEAWFLNYCADHGCLPDVMIWHELGELSSEKLDEHVLNYRNLEQIMAEPVGPLPIIITEYGMMEECGNPAKMFRYIRQIEETGVYGNIAYWRLADNLCDNTADGVSPNACWWLYRWYADMEGNLLSKDVRDLFHADFKNAVRDGRPLRYKHFNAFGAVNKEKNEIRILAGGADYTGRVKIKNLGKLNLGRAVRVKVESVTFEGLGGKVFAPTFIREYDAPIPFGSLTVKLPDMDINSVYHITVTPAPVRGETVENTFLPVRYEFENGRLLGTAYTYDSAYATTGEIAGMVGGIEHEGDGVLLKFFVPETGSYDLSFIYGKANDGPTPADRVSALADLSIDGKRQTISLPNTIRSEYTAKYTVTAWLDSGDHTVEFTHNTGTYVLDSLLVRKTENSDHIAVLKEAEACDETQTGYIAVAPETGWYTVEAEAETVTVNGAACGGKTVYLRQGLNLIELPGQGTACAVAYSKADHTVVSLSAEALTLSGGAKVENHAVTGITSNGGEARFTVNAPNAGAYCVTLTYYSNAEGGYHAYNVDLIEQYFTVSAGGSTQRVWCRNTYSEENVAEVTFSVILPGGRSDIVLYNDGSVRFDGRDTESPGLCGVSVHRAWLDD